MTVRYEEVLIIFSDEVRGEAYGRYFYTNSRLAFQVAFGDDGSCQELLSLWESFQPLMVVVDRGSVEFPSSREERKEEDERKEGEEREEEEQKENEEKEEDRMEDVLEDDEDVFDEAEDNLVDEKTETFNSNASTAGRKTVSFAPLQLLVQVHHLDDDDEDAVS